MSFTRRVFAVGIAAVLVLGSGCSGDDDDDASGSSTTETTVRGGTSTTAAGSSTSASQGSTTTASGNTTATTDGPAASCQSAAWNTDSQTGDGVEAPSAGSIFQVNAGRHDGNECYDQLTFVLNGPNEAGYTVNYGDFGDDDPPVAGTAFLSVSINAQISGGQYDPQGHTTPFAQVGSDVYKPSNPAGLSVVKQVRLYREDPGQTQFVVGIDGDQAFRVRRDVTSDRNLRIIVQIAHKA